MNTILAPVFYLSRSVDESALTRIPADAVQFDPGKEFIELDNVDKTENAPLSIAMVYNEFTVLNPCMLSMIIGADWQFKLYLNGELQFNTFEHNKQESIFSTFQVNIQTRAGKNLLALEVTRGAASSYFTISEGVKQSIQYSPTMEISLDVASIKGRIKPMNAVNNGPKTAGDSQVKSNTASWNAAKIPYARNHDASISGYGSAHIVDVHMIFPDFAKDPYDPASYDFVLSDIYHQAIIDGGTKIFYRLGSRIEHSIVKYGTKKPADFNKWAVICEHIIRHYTEGWANGFKWNIQYWEIWNEPDLSSGQTNKRTWGGTDEEFFEMYRIAACHLKKQFPHLKIGGPALAGSIQWAKRFLQSISSGKRVPLDFFSWHIYTSNPRAVPQMANVMRGLLANYGYQESENILNEWNYIRNWTTGFVYSTETIIGIKGAAFTAAVMNEAQNSPVDLLMYYDARPGTGFNGLWDFYTMRPLKSYYTFCLWSKLAELGKQFAVTVPANHDISAVGATDGNGKIGILISRFYEEDQLPPATEVKLAPGTFSLQGAKLYLLDKENDLAEKPLSFNADGTVSFEMEANSVAYIEK